MIVVESPLDYLARTAEMYRYLSSPVDLDLLVYTAPVGVTDFVAPNIWSVEATKTPPTIEFSVQLEDDDGGIQRTLVLYRDMAVNSWSAVDLTYDPQTGYATGSIADIPGSVEYFVQAVDEFIDRLRLVTGSFKIRDDFELRHDILRR